MLRVERSKPVLEGRGDGTDQQHSAANLLYACGVERSF
jgi:hypothetical protein